MDSSSERGLKLLTPQRRVIGWNGDRDGSLQNKMDRSSSRKVLEISKLKESLRGSLSSTKKKIKPHHWATVKEINLTSTKPVDKLGQRYMTTQSSSKRLLTVLRKETELHSRQNRMLTQPPNPINIIHKPNQDSVLLSFPKPLPNTHQSNCISSNILCDIFQSKSPSQQPQVKKLQIRMKRQRPDIHNLKIQKRCVKIVTSNEFNMKRTGENFNIKHNNIQLNNPSLNSARHLTNQEQ